jgi:hypothetical protein
MHPGALRLIDHCVLPVADLGVARQRLTALGFTVAPEGVHPFGTKNACVYFADDTFLEPLARGNAGAISQAGGGRQCLRLARRGLRRAHGEEGFSALVFKTDDADADHEAFSQGRAFCRADADLLAALRRQCRRERDGLLQAGLRRRAAAARHLFLHLPAHRQPQGRSLRARTPCQRRVRHQGDPGEAPDVDAARGFLARTCPRRPEPWRSGRAQLARDCAFPASCWPSPI